MIISKMSLPRRTFLRGLGAAVALPLLDAMVPALSVVAQTAANPVAATRLRLHPDGHESSQWMPAVEGRLTDAVADAELAAPHLDYLTVVSNLELRNANTDRQPCRRPTARF